MSARLRKKKLYRQAFNALVFEQMLDKLVMDENFEGWRVIESDVMRLFGNDRLAARVWFTTPAIGLDGNRPADLVASGNVEVVRDYLTRLQYGVYT
jgi:putative toxin-antitoxin system antitoxin component (TIGR02293 family)